jgi:hypothetical protein
MAVLQKEMQVAMARNFYTTVFFFTDVFSILKKIYKNVSESVGN